MAHGYRNSTAQQRAKVLGWTSLLAAPYGSTVHVKKKPFDAKGPRRRELAFETKWSSGKYVGLSSLLHKGHVIYLPPTDASEEKFLHSGHVRSGLRDPGLPDAQLHVSDDPRRRVVGKRGAEHVEMKQVNLDPGQVQEMATTGAQKLLETWDYEDARDMVVDLAHRGFFDEVKFGVFRHGGTVGWLKGFDQYPELSRLLARMVLEAEPTATFTSIWVSHNSMRPLHQDLNMMNGPTTMSSRYKLRNQVESCGRRQSLWTYHQEDGWLRP